MSSENRKEKDEEQCPWARLADKQRGRADDSLCLVAVLIIILILVTVDMFL